MMISKKLVIELLKDKIRIANEYIENTVEFEKSYYIGKKETLEALIFDIQNINE